MWKNFPLFPDAASTFAGEVDALFAYLVGVSAFFTLLIATLVLVFASRYRRKAADDGGEPPPRIDGILKLELLWIVIPLLLTLSFFAWGAKVFFDINRSQGEALDVWVTGKQWMWKLQHASGAREINELHVPVGRRVRLTMASEDVIHSFYVPAFRMKRDVVPGRVHRAWFEATRVGRYHLFCAEYCGTKHSEMIGTVHVLEPAAYEQWLSGAPAGDRPEVAGRKIFEGLRCDSCHGGGAEARGPSLQGVFGSEVALASGGSVVADEDYLRESVLRPMAKVVAGWEPQMPTYEGQLGEEQVLQLIAYIKSLAPEPAR